MHPHPQRPADPNPLRWFALWFLVFIAVLVGGTAALVLLGHGFEPASRHAGNAAFAIAAVAALVDRWRARRVGSRG